MTIKISFTIICGLILSAGLISCANRAEQKVEAQNNSNVRQSNVESNFKSDAKPENKAEIVGKSDAKNDKPIIKPSDIDGELLEKKKANPKITAKELAEFGNDLIKQKGVNFDIDLADLIEQKLESKEAKEIAEENEFDSVVAFNHSLTLADGTKKSFRITAPGSESCCCGYFYTQFPVSQITDKQLTVISDGKPYVIKRSKEIAFSQEHVLIDNQTMKKEIRKWQVPFETSPFGISQDGSKLYIEIEDEVELLLEISENGSIQFVPQDNPNIISNGKDLRDQPAPKLGEPIYKSGEGGFVKFTSGSKSFIVAFQYVCT